MIWWSAELSAQAGNSHHRAEIMRRLLHAAACAWRFEKGTRRVSSRRERSANPAPTPSPHGVTRQRIQSQAPRPSSIPVAVFPQPPTKEDPGAKRGPGSIAGWVRGWGLGGTPPGAMPQRRGFHPVPTPEIIFEPCPAGGGAVGASAPGAPGRPAVRHGGHRETPDIATGCEDGPARRRGPQPRSACRPGTGWGDRLQGNP